MLPGCALWTGLNTPGLCRPGSGPDCVCSGVLEKGQQLATIATAAGDGQPATQAKPIQPDQEGVYTIADLSIVQVAPIANGNLGMGSCFEGYWSLQDCGASALNLGQLGFTKCADLAIQSRDKIIQAQHDYLMAEAAAQAAAAAAAPVHTNCIYMDPFFNCTTSQY